MASLGLASLPVQLQTPPNYQQHPPQQQQGLLNMTQLNQSTQQQQHQQQQMQAMPQIQPHPINATAITIKLVTLAGERFKDLFYTVFDLHRTDVSRFFSPQSILVWDGHGVSSGAHIKQFFEMLPASKHKIDTFDVQPITGGGEMRGHVGTFLVTVTGTIAWGLSANDSSSASNGFFHSFVIERSQGVSNAGKQYHHIIQATMRTRYVEEYAPDQAQRKKRSYGGRN